MNAVVETEQTLHLLPPGEYVKLSFTDEGWACRGCLKKISTLFHHEAERIGLGLASVHSISNTPRRTHRSRLSLAKGLNLQFTCRQPERRPKNRLQGLITEQTQPHEEGSILFMDEKR